MDDYYSRYGEFYITDIINVRKWMQTLFPQIFMTLEFGSQRNKVGFKEEGISGLKYHQDPLSLLFPLSFSTSL
jgi:hypothetical protein